MQLDFFPEEIKVLESDAIDISTIEFDPTLAKGKQIVRDWLYSEVVAGKYFLYKTGGINRWHQDKGQTFPYLQNKHTGNIIKPTQVGIGYPVININEFIKKKFGNKSISIDENDNGFFIAVGRLTKQKNFMYLIDEFKKFLNIYPNEKLFIFGDGELKKKILRKIESNGMSQNIKLCGYTDNIYKYMLKSKAFILSSLWEDPGFVMIESAICNLFVISSNCKNGPKEFLLNGKAGLIYKSNVEEELFKKLEEFMKLDENTKFIRKVLAKKNSRKFTLFRHYLSFKNIID